MYRRKIIRIIVYNLVNTVLQKETQIGCQKLNKFGDKELNLVHTDVLLQPENTILCYPLMSRRISCHIPCS